jgi:hypothetical protein
VLPDGSAQTAIVSQQSVEVSLALLTPSLHYHALEASEITSTRSRGGKVGLADCEYDQNGSSLLSLLSISLPGGEYARGSKQKPFRDLVEKLLE